MSTVVFTVLFYLMPVATDLEKTAELALQREQPIVLYVSRSDCTFCRALERNVFAPLIKSEIFADRVQFRELVMDSGIAIRDFDATPLLPQVVAERYNVEVTPTILFLNGKNQEIVDRLVGYNGNEFFSYYLEKRIDKARTRTSSLN
jgi:thioredoxin-related protein